MYVSGLENFSDANGDGFRTVLYVSGCSHHCNGCQNPQTWNPKNGVKYNDNIEAKVIKMLSSHNISGLTLSGGDPLYENNLDDILHLLHVIRDRFGNTKNVWLYTGYKFNGIFNSFGDFIILYPDCMASGLTRFGETPSDNITNSEIKRSDIIKMCDVLVDGRFEADKKDLKLKFRGSSNQRLIDVKKSVKEGKTVLLD